MSTILETANGRTKITLKATSGHPYLKKDELFEVHPVHEAGLKSKKWAVDPSSTDTDVTDAAKPQTLEEAATTEAKTTAPKPSKKK